MTDVLVTENITGKALDELARAFSVLRDANLWRDSARLQSMLAGVRALIVRNQTNVTEEVIRAGSQLKIIARAGAGLDNIDTDAATAAGVVVSFSPDANSVSVAEMTLGLMLCLAHKIPQAHAETRCGAWNRLALVGCELAGKILGVVGMGRIGRLTAARAAACGMRILAHDTLLDARSPVLSELRADLVPLDELLELADVVTCHVPLTSRTRGMFMYEHFCRMKPGSLFVNTSRGEVVQEEGLIRALREGRLAGAALDVRAKEPPELGPLNEMDNVILTPHIAAFTIEAQDRVVDTICRDVRAVLAGRPAESFANFPSPRRA
jgi:D-3-phosphoglycerate dehydrogenase